MAFVVNNTRGAVLPSMMAPPNRGVVFFFVAILLARAVWPAVATPSTGKPAEAPIPVLDLAQLETQMWRLVNHERTSPKTFAETKGQARPLEWDSRLAAVARAHSEEMAAYSYFGHQGMDGSSPAVRVSSAGIRWLAQGENIAKAIDPIQAEGMFMDEPKFQPNHRGNILKRDYNRVGIGIAKAADGSLYITQEFAQIP